MRTSEWRIYLRYLHAPDLDEEGLFRISGSLAAVNELVDKYNSGTPHAR